MATIKCTCIYKYRDNSGNIKGYKLQDTNGHIKDIESNELKNEIRAKNIEVDNLTLTSDNRLLSKTAEAINNERLAKIKERCQSNKLGSKYQKLFTPLGIDVMTAVYLAYPKDGDDINSIYKRTFRNDSLNDIRELVVDPTPIIGKFSSSDSIRYENGEYASRYKNADLDSNDNVLLGGEIESKVILMILHKNGGYRTVIFSEISNLSSLGNIAQYLKTRKEDAAKYNLSVISLNADKQPVVTNVGKNISERERKILAERILASNVDLWVGQEATKNIITKVDKQQAAIKLRRIGMGTLGIPFAAVGAVGALGISLVTSTLGEIINMSVDERVVLGEYGMVGVEMYRKVKEKLD